jgi:hypothetical protein
MSAESLAGSKAMMWGGRVVSTVPVLLLIMSAVMKFSNNEQVVEGFADWPAGVALALGIVELGSTIVYLIPQTAVLGAILLTGYLGGATATHVRLGESVLIPVALGVLVWLGLWLRDSRLRALTPLRRAAASP